MRIMESFFLALFALLVFVSTANSQTYLEKDLKNLIKEKYQFNVNNFILDKVIDNKVVMIADQGHGKHIFMKTVIDYLNYWIDTLQHNVNKGKNIPRKLYLILESDSNQINSIYKYFSSNNPYDLLNPEFIYGYQYTSAFIEFYDDLRNINCKVDSINKNLSEESKISFKLYGPEKVIDMDGWSTEKRDTYFIHERDENSSNQIINQLEKDSTAKALIFYGGAHLITIETQKLQNRQEQGYYIGHYLLEYFRDKGGLFSIDQVSLSQNNWINECYRCSEKDYAIENSIFDGFAIPNNMQPQFTDASLILFDNNIKQPHISQIWSDNLIDCFLNNADKFSDLRNDINRGIISAWFYYLSIISGYEIENINFNDSLAVTKAIKNWTNWRENKRTNNAEEIINQSIIKNRVTLFEKSDYPIASRYEYDLGNMLLNAKVWYSLGASTKVRAQGYYDYIQNYSKPIITENLINLLWIGTDGERQKATDYLKKTFSLNFNTAKEWTEWWRNSEFCN